MAADVQVIAKDPQTKRKAWKALDATIGGFVNCIFGTSLPMIHSRGTDGNQGAVSTWITRRIESRTKR